SVNLDLYSLELISGNGGGASLYETVDLPNVDLGAGDYYVVCGNSANVANCDLDVLPDTGLIQNGAPDAAALLYKTEILDTVSYEGDTGARYTEGSGSGLSDSSTLADKGISRCPDGVDTDQNNVDFILAGITPGGANSCVAPTSTTSTTTTSTTTTSTSTTTTTTSTTTSTTTTTTSTSTTTTSTPTTTSTTTTQSSTTTTARPPDGEIPEFPTAAIPAGIAALGYLAIRRLKKEE
ncbi:MAG: hypothetical protein ACC644_06325, partial [Candidatus Hydrothermarchaeales archaeon]